MEFTKKHNNSLLPFISKLTGEQIIWKNIEIKSKWPIPRYNHSSTVLNEDLKRLYGLGYFTDVRIEQEDFEDGTKVLFAVVEKPILSEITIEGNLKLKKDQIKKEMQLLQRQVGIVNYALLVL